MVKLYVYGTEPPQTSRAALRVVSFPDADSALAALERAEGEDVIICDARLVPHVLFDRLADDETCDIMHAGLSLGAREAFQSLLLTNRSWFFLDPRSDRRVTSWKATPALCRLRPATVRALGGFDQAYTSAAGKLMDFAYRVLAAGGRVCHDPQWLASSLPPPPQLNVPLGDEFTFIQRHLSRREAWYAAFWLNLRGTRPFAIWQSFRAALKRGRQIPAPGGQNQTLTATRLMSENKKQHVGSITTIIPTINRYDYLPQAIESVLRLEPRPAEIIVIDQTPPEERRIDIYDQYAPHNVRPIFLDHAGQSSARNAGIQAAVGEWCFLFDDDSVAWEGALAEHVAAVEHSGAAVSTGVSLAPWKNITHIPPQIRHFHLANVLDTGNSFVKKEALLDVGGLDLAFDHGSGADSNLGTRLYLKGYEIVFNPRAIRTHYKAPVGGLRTHGAWWLERTTFWAPYPPPTFIYNIQSHYPRSCWAAHYLLLFLRAGQRHKTWEIPWLWLSSPWKLARALRAARKLQTKLGWSPKEIVSA